MDADISLRRHVAVLRRGLRTILVFVTVGVLSALAVNLFATRVYEARAEILVGPVLEEAQPDINRLLAAQRLATTYAELASTTSFLERVRTTVGLGERIEDIQRSLIAIAPPESLFIQIAFQHRDPSTAARFANEVANALVEAAPTAASGGGPEVVRPLQIVGVATPPADPVSPRSALNIVAGFVAGLLGGVIIVYLRGLIRDDLDDVEEAAELAGVPILGVIGPDGRTGEPADAVALARLVKRLELIDEGPSRVVLAAAGNVQTGWAAEEIAAHFGSLGRLTLLLRVDARAVANEGRHSMSLERLLASGGNTEPFATEPSPYANVRILRGGPGVEAAAVVATSDRAASTVATLSRAVDNVVIAGDSPTTSIATLVLAKEATAIVLAVDPRVSQRRDVTGAVAALRSVGSRLVGIAVLGGPSTHASTIAASATAGQPFGTPAADRPVGDA